MKKIMLLFALIISTGFCFAQNVGIGTTTPDTSAILDVKSSGKGMLIPRISTAARNAISNPATGLLVFDTDQKTLYLYDGNDWRGFAAMNDDERPVNNYNYPTEFIDTSTLAGYSVSMWGQFLVIGAPYTFEKEGTVYIYINDTGNWQPIGALTSTAGVGALFGQSVSLKGNYLIVGAPGAVNYSINEAVGAVYIYHLSGFTFVPLQPAIYGTVVGNGFGTTVAINQAGTYAAVSEPNATVSGFPNAGQVDVYNNPGSTFVLQTTISDAAPATNEYFGTALAMNPSGENIGVGAPNKTVGSYDGEGYAAQFNRNGNTWVQAYSYTPAGSEQLNMGKQVDITDAHFAWATGQTNTVDVVDLGWTGSTITPFTSAIKSIAFDPTSEALYVFSGNTLYAGNTGAQIKIFSSTNGPIISNQMLSIYNKYYVLGLPSGTDPANVNEGGFYFGVSPQ